jgi:hypothetical protein
MWRVVILIVLGIYTGYELNKHITLMRCESNISSESKQFGKKFVCKPAVENKQINKGE